MELNPLRLFACDLNFSCYTSGKPNDIFWRPSAPQDWKDVDPSEYVNWHIEFGNNIIHCHAYTFSGYALYPSKLGPLAPDRGSQLFPGIYELAQKNNMPMMSCFNSTADLVMSNLRDDWVVTGSREGCHFGFLAPETDWTALLCDRIFEFLSKYPVEYMLFDWFVYGNTMPDKFKIRPSWYMKDWFKKIIGREIPQDAGEISEEENLKYKREILSMQFYKIKEAAKSASPNTKLIFNVPYHEAHEKLWERHPMLEESDILYAESSKSDVVEWLIDIKKPWQRVMTTIIGRPDDITQCDPDSWEKWYYKDCDLTGYAIGNAPDFRPDPRFNNDLKIVKNAFHKIRDLSK
ncbi:MAG: hypothetical protein Q7J78_04385 [Clostridiales bacterium]|nr:hypothetical protein [Clostridiales bacterium]